MKNGSTQCSRFLFGEKAMEHKKIFDKNIYSHEMDYQGYYPPSSMHRLCNSSYFGCMRDNGLPYPAIRAKINATHIVGLRWNELTSQVFPPSRMA